MVAISAQEARFRCARSLPCGKKRKRAFGLSHVATTLVSLPTKWTFFQKRGGWKWNWNKKSTSQEQRRSLRIRDPHPQTPPTKRHASATSAHKRAHTTHTPLLPWLLHPSVSSLVFVGSLPLALRWSLLGSLCQQAAVRLCTRHKP
jgi:hypothetical protein